MGPSDLDIERVEIIPGTTSALYGLNSVNGLANFITKDPFIHRGITVQQKTGVNHLTSNFSGATNLAIKYYNSFLGGPAMVVSITQP